MKKLVLISAVVFIACNAPKTESVCTDSCTKSCTDSTKVDTLNPRGEVDTTILKTVK